MEDSACVHMRERERERERENVCACVVSYKAVCLRSGSLCCCSAVVHQIDLCLLVDDSQC